MRQKINKKAVVGRLVVGLFFVAQILAKKVEALVYDAGGDNDWCTADLQTNLNSTSSGFYSWFTSEQQGYFLATDDSCTNAKVSVPTAAVWNNAKEIYRQSVNGAASSDYLEATTESVWTRTAANTGTVYAITNDGLSSQETAVTSEIQTLPLVFLTTDLCAKTTVAADGSVAYPYMAEICDLTLGGNYFDLSSNTFCGSHIQTKLNQDGETTAYYNFFNYLEKKYLLSQDCSSPITLMTTTQWEAGKEAYRQALNGAASGNYLANGAATAWTQTAGTTGTAYAVASNGGAATETAIEMGEVEALPVVYFSEEAMTTGAGAGTLADPYVLATLSVAYDAGGDNNWCRSDLAEKLNSNSLGGFLADLGVLEAGYLNVSDWSANTVTPQETSCSAKVGAVSEDEWTEVKEVYQAAIEEDTGGSQSYAPAGVANFWTRTAATTVGYAETVVGSSGLVEETAVTTSANYAAVPAVYFDETTVCAIEATGAGTAADPYVLTTTACPLTLTIDNNSQDLIATIADGLTLSGTVTDERQAGEVVVQTTLSGVTKTTTVTAPVTAGAWSLSWTFEELQEGIYTGQAVEAASGASEGEATKSGEIIVDKTAPFCYPVQEATVSGTPSLILTDSAGVAKNYRIEGQSYQAVTPSPATPSAVVSLGEDAAVQVVSEGKNLLNIEEMFALDNVTYDELSSNEYFITASTDLFNVGFPLSTSEQIVLSAQIKKYDTRASGLRYRIYYTDDTYTESNTVFTITDNYQTVTAVSTLGKTVSKIGLAYSQTNEQFYVKNVMVEYGSTATAYQPYVAPQTTTIDLTGHEPLRCVGTGANKVCDYVDYGNGRIVRNVGKFIPRSNMGWGKSGWYQARGWNAYNFKKSDIKYIAYGTRMTSTHYGNNASGAENSYQVHDNTIMLNNNNNFYIVDNSLTTIEEFKNFIDNNDIEVYYQLATPTTEPIALPTLHTVEGDGTVTATDGNLTSSYMMVNFFQKADIPHWTPSAPVALKATPATQEFVLSDIMDAGGSGLAAASYSCTAAAENGATCNAQVSDNAGNTAVCLSPANRIDTEAPVDGGIVYDGGLILEATASVQLVATDGADLVSGLDLTSRRLLRRFATLTEDAGNYTCENDWGEWLTTPYTGTYPDLMAAVRFGGSTCNQFAWSIADVAGNVAIFPGTNVIQVMANTAPTITIDNPTARLVATVTGGLQITGTVSDVDAGQTLRVSMTVGSEQAMSSASPQTAAPWRLKWTWAELVHGVYQNVPATVNDTISEATADYTGEIIVDKLLPTIRVTAPAAAVGENAQAIVVEATAGASGLQRIGFLWDQELNSVCTNGTAVLSGADIGGTQPDGQHTLHLCAVSNAGLVSFLNQTYNFNPLPIVPELERQVTGNNLWWNAKEIDPLSPSFTLSGLYQPTGQVYNYQLQLTIKDSNRAVALTKTLTVETSTTTITPFVFTILTSELNLSAQNNSFPGPMILTLTDLATNQVREVEWNLNLLAPIYQIDNLVNTGNYIRVYDSTISQIPSLQNFSASSCDSWQPVTGNDYSNAYGKKSDNPYLAAFSLRDERDGKIYEVRKLADGNCWIVTNMAYGECTANSFVDSETAASCRTNPVSNQYGYLYNYMAAQTVCPAGWHLPSGGASGEWAALQAAANELTFWQPGGGFAGLYSGQATSSEISGQGLNGLFWSQTSAATNGYCLKVDATTVDGVSELNKAVGVAARCIKD